MKAFPWWIPVALLAVAIPIQGQVKDGTAPSDPVVGLWKWQGRDTVTVYEDGTAVSSKGVSATWRFLDNKEQERKYEFVWKGGLWVHSMRLVRDNQKLDGRNQNGSDVSATRLRGQPVARKTPPALEAPPGVSIEPNPEPAAPPSVLPPQPSPISGEVAAATAELVRTYRNHLVFVSGNQGAGSGFTAILDGTTFLFTNAHVAAGVKGAGFQALDGSAVKTGAPSVAVGHDIFRMKVEGIGKPLEIMKGVDENAVIGDEIVVLGNAKGAGVINTITGKIIGLGPSLVELDAPFVPGNSGSPIIHIKTGKVIGVATYAVIQRFDPTTKEKVKDPVVRRFGYRIDSVKSWQSVNWPAFHAQAATMANVERLTDDLIEFLRDLATDSRVTAGRHTNPVIRSRVDSWLAAKSKRLSAADRKAADANLISFIKVASQTDVNAARAQMSYDYFQRGLAEHRQNRTEIAELLDGVIKELR